MQHRLLATAAAVVALAAPLSSCGFDYATDRVYTLTSGANNREGDVDVLSAVVVSAAEGSGTFVASLSNNDPDAEQTFTAVGRRGRAPSTAAEFEPITIAAGGLVNLAEPAAGIVLTGEFTRRRRRAADGRLRQRRARLAQRPGRRRRHRLLGRHGRLVTHTLVLLRHGESEWNAKNLFTGWVDVALTEKGRGEAVRGGELLREAGLLPDVVHTSLQRRAINTAALSLDAADRHWIPVKRSWRLNERHYGALQGKDKKQTLEEYGEEQFMLWRRSFDTPPPPLDDSDEFSQAGDPRYADLGDELPRTECLKDVIARFLPYWEAEIVPDLQSRKTVLVAAHGNSLRALVKHLDGISDEDIAGLNIPTGMPLVYRLDDAMQPTVAGGEYLDPEAAAAAAAAVANQGR